MTIPGLFQGTEIPDPGAWEDGATILADQVRRVLRPNLLVTADELIE
jgi:hypothetical protein